MIFSRSAFRKPAFLVILVMACACVLLTSRFRHSDEEDQSDRDLGTTSERPRGNTGLPERSRAERNSSGSTGEALSARNSTAGGETRSGMPRAGGVELDPDRDWTSAPDEPTRRKLILFWTPKLGAADWNLGLGAEPFAGCAYSNCEFSSDKSRVRQASALLFYRRETPHFPGYRHPRQLYVHFSREPPRQVGDGYAVYGDAINASISYRRAGEMALPYFRLVRRSADAAAEPYRPRIEFAEKNRSVVWMVSNCRPASKRDVYVRELEKYIDVDVYGKCGNFTCEVANRRGNVWNHCFDDFERKYKFYLAFENEICDDYYTEKLANPLKHELVPVVLGGADYKRYFPDRSYIDVLDFPHPKQLAAFLKAMSATEYYSYFRWKPDYVMVVPNLACLLCEFLHNSSYARGATVSPQYKNNFTAWMYDSCDNDLIDRLRQKW